MRRLNHKGQNLAEYAIIFAAVVAVLTVMETYVKRGLQGRYKDATDAALNAFGAASSQYEPYYLLEGAKNTENTATITNKWQPGGINQSNMQATTVRTGVETFLPPGEEDDD